MTEEEVLRLAEEAGWTSYSLKHPVEVERLRRFAARVSARERALCVCEIEDLVAQRVPASLYADSLRNLK